MFEPSLFSETRCGGGAGVEHCSTVAARSQVLGGCEGREICGGHLYGHFRGRDPCPAAAEGARRPRKYLTIRYSCVSAASNSTRRRPAPATTPTPATSTSTPPPLEQLETELLSRLDTVTVLDQNVTDYVSEFFQQAINNPQPVSNKSSAPQTSILNVTERISKKLMDLLNKQDDISTLEFETSQLTVKLVRRKLGEGDAESATNWESRDKAISLPDQQELAQAGQLQVMMAAYDNMRAEMNSASDVISVSVNKEDNSSQVRLSKPVTFLLPNSGDTDVSCAFWSFSSSVWSREGCVTLCHNGSHTKCSCDHLTNFALIFNVHSEFIAEEGVHAHQLKYITYIGFTISIFCMVVTILLFLLLKGHSTDRDVIHVNLCLSLLTAEVIFMFGIDKTSNTALCSVISVLLHYFFLSSFAWMFLEGFQIYELLVKVFESSKTSRLKHFIIGYGVPLLIVISAVTVDFIKIYRDNDVEDMCFDPLELSSYGTSSYCWLDVDNNFVLSFIIPAVVVILSNVAMLVFAVHSMTVHKLQRSDKAPDQDLLVSYMKGVGVLMCLLGSTWIFGLLLLAFNNLVIAYTFTILNSLQGVGIFVFQCLLNPQTRRTLRRQWDRFSSNFCQRDTRAKYQRTNTYEITDLSLSVTNTTNTKPETISKEEGQKD